MAIAAVTMLVAFLFFRVSEASFTARAQHRSAEEAIHFAALFYFNVWSPSLQGNPDGAIWALHRSLVNTFSRDTTFGLNLVRVSVFDLDGALVYSTDPGVAMLQDLPVAPLSRQVVLQGQAFAVLERDEAITLPSREKRRLDVIDTLAPLRNASPESPQEGAIVGLLHISQDVTRDLATARAQAIRTAIIGSLGTGAVLFTLLVMFVLRADRQLRRQQEELDWAHAQGLQVAQMAATGMLISGVAHELNNPLTGISGLSELLLRRPLAQDVKEEARMIHQEAHRSIRIVQDLLAFARPTKAERVPTSLNTAVEQVLSLRKYELQTENLQVERDLDPALPLVLATPHALQQVVLNLVVNAEQAMVAAHDQGTLRLETRRAGPMVRLVVKDDGPGIPRENLPRIFDPSYTTKEVGKGTGLGLSICSSIVREHGGMIRAESAPGQGATFIVELPAVLGASGKKEDRPSGPVPVPRLRGVSDQGAGGGRENS